jgi:membrane-bound serine protease (ClpP class)
MPAYIRLIILLLLAVCMQLSFSTRAQAPARAKVFVMEIRDEINPPMRRYVTLALEEATRQQADYVLIDMDTYGGAVNDADAIRTMILEYEKPIYVFINKNAASAGALISLACEKIFMDKGANIGAATVVSGTDGSKAPDKYQSYMRSMMRSTAESHGRDPLIAEAMVDENVEIEGITKAGQVLTFTTTEAIKHNFCDGQAADISEVIALSGIGDHTLIRYQLSATEKIIAFFMQPAISGLLILIILGGLYFELQTPGVGFPILASIVAIILYFTPYYLNGLAENWEIILFGIGLLLLAAEIFVIPGFGIAGISGLLLAGFALTVSMLNNDWFDFTMVGSEELVRAIVATLVGLGGAIAAILFIASNIFKTRLYKRVALQEVLDSQDGYTIGGELQSLVGTTAVAYTVLRPGGKVVINDQVYDAFTRGGFIEKGAAVEIIGVESSSLRVKEINTAQLNP